ncbi:MAG: sigma 54-interacting transcriptional regulator [Holophagales bacterium]|nr:sigma 54-interacting transcriptional regulator [Holophagales bacterium]
MADTHDQAWRSKLAAETRPQPLISGSASRMALPCLTIVYHDDLRRIGDVCQLGRLMSGEPRPISRIEPLFGGAGRPRRPLLDPHLSRTPFEVRLRRDGSALSIDAGITTTPIRVDGEALDGSVALPLERLDTGVGIQLAESVVLLLHMRDPVPDRSFPRFGLVGESDAVLQVCRDIERVARLDVPVLIRGETGTGKELVARALHHHGPRSTGSLVSVNMAAVPPSLASSELFGSVKGAFTGAAQRPGHFVEADGGTPFLDEIGETPEEMQPLLLRALESGEVQPVGAAKPRQVDVRLVAATDADLERAISEGRFRAPLLHRLAGFELRVPPLRQRLDDLGLLFFHFLWQEISARGNPAAQGAAEDAEDAPRPELSSNDLAGVRPWLSASLIARLLHYPWPGNVRQLRNLVRQLWIVGQHGGRREVARRAEELLQEGSSGAWPVRAQTGSRSGAFESLDSSAPTAESPEPSSYRKASEVSEEELVRTLREHGWRFQPTAKALRVSRTTLYRLIDRSPRVRKPSELEAETILDALERLGPDRDLLAEALEVSRQGLDQRIRQLGLDV